MSLNFSKNLPKDTYRHKGMRRKLVDVIARKGIKDTRILEVMELLPRHFFMDKAFEELAYEDKAFPIGSEQTISQPFTVAYQTQLLEIKQREKILEVGTGSGYQAAILAMLGARVFTIERQEPLFHSAKKILRELGLENIRCRLGDGWKGLREFAPFDKIIVTAGAEKVPEKLKAQLKVGGILVIPIGIKSQRMFRIKRLSEEGYSEEILDTFRFVPMLKGVVKN